MVRYDAVVHTVECQLSGLLSGLREPLERWPRVNREERIAAVAPDRHPLDRRSHDTQVVQADALLRFRARAMASSCCQ
jgi:hypothetical protein